MTRENRDFKRRAEIMGYEYKTDEYEHQSFEGMNLETLQALIDENFAALDDAQNDAPTLEEFRDFITENHKFTLHGYTIGGSRHDARVSIEGLHGPADFNLDDVITFFNFCRYADELTIEKGERLRSWWD